MNQQDLNWWCDLCDSRVDILIAHNNGVYCQNCGNVARLPDDSSITGKLFWDVDDSDNEMDIMINRIIK